MIFTSYTVFTIMTGGIGTGVVTEVVIILPDSGGKNLPTFILRFTITFISIFPRHSNVGGMNGTAGLFR